MADKTVAIGGKKIPKWAAFGAIGVITVGGVLWYRKRKSASTSTASDPNAIDPVTGLPYSEDGTIDPATGLAYLAEAQQYGSVSAAEASYASSTGLGGSGSGGGSGIAYGTPTTNVGGVTPTQAASGITSNADWATQAIADLEALGYSASASTSAVAAYLAGMQLTSAQAPLVQTIVSEIGPPPTGTFSINVAPSGTVSGSGSTGSTGSSGGGPIKVAPTGFRVVSVTNGDNVNLAWNPVRPPPGQGPLTGYMIAYGPTSGSQKYKQEVGGQTTEATVPGVGGGAAGKHYFELWALPAKTGGPHAGPIEATTKKS